jgi:hypothetical protein
MRERFKQWQPKIRINKGWVIGAIAAVAGGVFLWLNVRTANRNVETANLEDADPLLAGH